MRSTPAARAVDWLEARSAEAVAVVGLLVLLVGSAVVADHRAAEADRLEAGPEPTSAAPEPTLRLVPPVVAAAPTTAPAPTPAPTSAPTTAPPSAPPSPLALEAPEPAPTSTSPEPAGRVVVLSVEAPVTVRVGEAVTFRVAVRATGGTPVLTGARFGDGTDGGVPAPCAGLAGPSFRGELTVTHTYAVAGTYQPYFVAALPCGPSAGSGTTLVVTGAATPTPTGPPSATPTASPVPEPAPSGLPSP